MSSFVWMKVLESSPERYDAGIRRLSGGRIGEVYDRMAEEAAGPGRRVLDVGCGTGGVSLACAARGAEVIGLDRNAEMLEVARGKPVPGPGSVRWVQATAAEIEDHVDPGSLDAVVSCLAFSEMSPRKQDHALQRGLVQCPEDALRFRYEDGRVVEPATIRRTRMNMLGRRTVEVER